MAARKDMKALEAKARAQGWTIVKGGKRDRWVAPSGQIVFASSNCSDVKGIRAHTALLRRNGFIDA
jgi:hypothetical protein